MFGISIHALREEGDAVRDRLRPAFRISIHALREEGDGLLIAPTRCLCNFYPRPPRGGRQPYMPEVFHDVMKFLSTPSARRATSTLSLHGLSREFLSTPSARRATLVQIDRDEVARVISIHALREEGDVANYSKTKAES